MKGGERATPHPQQAGAENTIMTERTQENGHRQSMHSLLCVFDSRIQREDVYHLLHSTVHCKKSLAVFSQAGMSLFKLSLGGESLFSDIPAVDGKIASLFFTVYTLGRHNTDCTVTEKRCAAKENFGRKQRKNCVSADHFYSADAKSAICAKICFSCCIANCLL